MFISVSEEDAVPKAKLTALSSLIACAALFLGTGVASAAPQSGPPEITLEWGADDSGDPTLRSSWGAGACIGYCHDATQVNGFMEWGADTHCSGSGWIPHQLRIVLEQKEVVDWGFDRFHEVAWANSTAAQFQSPDISLHEHWRTCDDFANTDYRIIAHLTAGSHKKTTLSDEYTVNCVYDEEINND